MGNSKSRQQQNAGQYFQKSSSRNGGGGGQDRVRPSKYVTNSSSSRQQQQYHNQQQQSPLLNDSGHYSIHGFMASPSSPVEQSETPTMNGGGGGLGVGGGGGLGWNHLNLSSPGRLDQTKKPSDSSLHLQFQHGTRAKGTTGYPSGTPAGGAAAAGGRLSAAGNRMSGTMPRTAGQGHDGVNEGYGYDNSNYPNNINSYNNNSNMAGGQEMMSIYKQQGPDLKSLSIPPHQLQQASGRMSSLLQPEHATAGMRNSASISNIPYVDDDLTAGGGAVGLGGMASSIAAMNLNDRQQAQQQQQQRLQQGQRQQQQQQYAEYPDQQRNSLMQPYQQQHPHYQQGSINNSRQGSMMNAAGVNPAHQQQQQQYYHQNDAVYANQDSTAYQQKQQQQQYYHVNQQQPLQQFQQPRLTTTYPVEPPRERLSINNNGGPMGTTTTTTPKPSAFLANAGPLIDMGSTQRPPTTDQVFARLARQFPTNPREAEKRERIYRWLGQIVEALTFNPDTETPGCIIPVYPDELDHPESITYELDLMAPVAKPFRKAIDINCVSGDWAMDMAIKYPRTLVYALDSLLATAHLPLRIPDNCKFRMRDARDQEGEFDLVHQRLGAFRTPIQEWTPHFAEMRRLTRPGGWIQMAESDGMVVRAGLETSKVNRWVEQAALSSGLNPPQLMGALMPTVLGAGLINVECYDYSIPLGEWAGLRGQVAMRKYLEMVDSLKEEIIDMNRLEEGFFEETIELMKMECQEEKAELIMRVICAQKPPITDDLWRTAR
ncbi:hypothetical protein BGX23_008304 [Mortierella sp. AD031]|nr:hypothetical protein BGX23_008304 [Mortierella sp. AD031]